MFGAAPRMAAAETTAASFSPPAYDQSGYAPQGGGGGYGQQGGATYRGAPPAPAPASAPPPAPGVPARPGGFPPGAIRRKRGSRPTPPPPMPGDAPSLATFVQQELTNLRNNDGQDVWLRAGLLTALSERIRVLLTTWQQNNEPAEARTTLGTLSTELATPTADPAEVDRRWQHALTTLEAVTAGGNPRPRRPFWKR